MATPPSLQLKPLPSGKLIFDRAHWMYRDMVACTVPHLPSKTAVDLIRERSFITPSTRIAPQLRQIGHVRGLHLPEQGTGVTSPLDASEIAAWGATNTATVAVVHMWNSYGVSTDDYASIYGISENIYDVSPYTVTGFNKNPGTTSFQFNWNDSQIRVITFPGNEYEWVLWVATRAGNAVTFLRSDYTAGSVRSGRLWRQTSTTLGTTTNWSVRDTSWGPAYHVGQSVGATPRRTNCTFVWGGIWRGRAFDEEEMNRLAYAVESWDFLKKDLRRTRFFVSNVVVSHPNADTAAGSWTPQGGPSTLWECVDENGAYNDTDYIQSAATPSSDACVMKLSTLTTPAAAPVRLKIRHRDGSGFTSGFSAGFH